MRRGRRLRESLAPVVAEEKGDRLAGVMGWTTSSGGKVLGRMYHMYYDKIYPATRMICSDRIILLFQSTYSYGLGTRVSGECIPRAIAAVHNLNVLVLRGKRGLRTKLLPYHSALTAPETTGWKAWPTDGKSTMPVAPLDTKAG